jgi:hypothetical protein
MDNAGFTGSSFIEPSMGNQRAFQKALAVDRTQTRIPPFSGRRVHKFSSLSPIPFYIY